MEMIRATDLSNRLNKAHHSAAHGDGRPGNLIRICTLSWSVPRVAPRRARTSGRVVVSLPLAQEGAHDPDAGDRTTFHAAGRSRSNRRRKMLQPCGQIPSEAVEAHSEPFGGSRTRCRTSASVWTRLAPMPAWMPNSNPRPTPDATLGWGQWVKARCSAIARSPQAQASLSQLRLHIACKPTSWPRGRRPCRVV